MSHCAAVWMAVQEHLYRVTSEPVQRKCSSSKRIRIKEKESGSVLEGLDDYFLSECFHATRAYLSFVIDVIQSRLKKDVFKPVHDSDSVEAMTLASLYFYTHGFISDKMRDLLGLDDAEAAEAVEVISAVLTDLSSRFITFPYYYNDRMGVAQGFKNRSGIPSVVGVLGCLHLRVNPPRSHHTLFQNPLGFHSVQVQIISDSDGNLLSVERFCPGSIPVHTVWEKSRISQEFTSFQHGQTWLVGGAGLPLSRHVLTPVEDSQVKAGAARRFNAAHSEILSSMQHVFGSLKTRFQCLRDLGDVQPDALEPVTRIITACCVLHNLSKKFSVPLPREPVLEPVLPAGDGVRGGRENMQRYTEEARDDMIETCFGNTGNEEGQ